MPPVKDLSSSSEKWANRASGASAEFEANAIAAADVWARNTVAAANNYQAGISQGNIAQRFARGVSRAAQRGKFATKLAAVGGSRYSSGVSVAKADWASGFEPYHGTLSTLQYPARRPRGDVANLERVKAVTTALHAKRIAMLGTS